MNKFSPIAVVGMGTVLPGSLNYLSLWDTVYSKKIFLDSLNTASQKSCDYLLSTKSSVNFDKAYTLNGGYVKGFQNIFNPALFNLDPSFLAGLDVVFQWPLMAAYEALACVKTRNNHALKNVGVILGNLSLPSQGLADYATTLFLNKLFSSEIAQRYNKKTSAFNRFMSGYPATVIAQALNLNGDAYAIEAACSTGIYAIKLACDQLQSGNSDLMLAGAVNAVCRPFLHVAFTAIDALSVSGQSRPFCANADGMLPAEGAAFVALKRLEDAVKANDKIYGVIRGIGLSNAGKQGSVLAPSMEAEIDSMTQAYQISGIDPNDISYVECHATGTQVGDRIELLALKKMFNNQNLVLGSLKANIGHSLTTSAIAGLIKILGCFNSKYLPVTPNAFPLNQEFNDSNFKVLKNELVWENRMIAGLNAFGLGGNNGHLIVENMQERYRKPEFVKFTPIRRKKIAVVSAGIKSTYANNIAEFMESITSKKNAIHSDKNIFSDLLINLKEVSIPPVELSKTMGQQLLLLPALSEALKSLAKLEPEATGVYIGMGIDAEVTRYYLRIKLDEIFDELNIKDVLENSSQIKDHVAPPLDSSNTIGIMPQLVANRLSYVLNAKGPSFTVSAEELSGDMAIKIAMDAISRGEINTAIVGAVDLSAELVHQEAITKVTNLQGETNDSAVILILKDFDTAQKDGEQILATINDEANNDKQLLIDFMDLLDYKNVFSGSHAVSGILNILMAILMSSSRIFQSNKKVGTTFAQEYPTIRVTNTNFANQKNILYIEPTINYANLPSIASDFFVYTYAAENIEKLIEALQTNKQNDNGECRLAFVCKERFFESKRNESLNLLKQKKDRDYWHINNISFSQKVLKGKLAFVYTGSASAYPASLQDIAQYFPGLIERGIEKKVISNLLPGHVFLPQTQPLSAFDQAINTSILSQIHAIFTQEELGITPDAAIGLSSGEIDALFAHGVWSSHDNLIYDVNKIGLYSDALSGKYNLAKKYWYKNDNSVVISWENYFVSAPIKTIQAAIDDNNKVFILVQYTNSQCVIGGEENECRKILNKLVEKSDYFKVNYDLIFHCKIAKLFESELRSLYSRKIYNKPAIRFYSNFLGKSYEINEDNVASAIVGQAISCIDFPRTINNAWDDGIRIYLEHGPKSNLSSSIEEILRGKEVIAIPLNVENKNAYEQVLSAAGQLWSLGINLNLSKFLLKSKSHQTPSWFKVNLRLQQLDSVKKESFSSIQNLKCFDQENFSDIASIYENLAAVHQDFLSLQHQAFFQYQELMLKISDSLKK